jgi:hypothetical protein
MLLNVLNLDFESIQFPKKEKHNTKLMESIQKNEFLNLIDRF